MLTYWGSRLLSIDSVGHEMLLLLLITALFKVFIEL